MDTIFALASARGKAGVAIIRLSGPLAFEVGGKMAGDLPTARQAALRRLVNDAGEALDDALVLRFDRGASFTGEDVVEFHLHGSPAIVAVVLDTLSRHDGLRLAEPGEFTRRALENGCLDLAQVEGLGDLIEAETEAQRKQAQRVFSGQLGALADTWRRDLVRAVSLLEATIDFVDDDVPVDVAPEVLALVNKTMVALAAESAGSEVAERIRDGFEVAIVGRPNVGKSTLLNRLAGRQAAITSEYAGTTRDVIEVRMDIHGLSVTFLDTAGIRDTSDAVENMGVKRAVERAQNADLRIFLVDSRGPKGLDIAVSTADIIVNAKSDLHNDTNGLSVSGLTGEGVSGLIERVYKVLGARAAGAGTATRMRHRDAIERAIKVLGIAADTVTKQPDMAEMACEEMRVAIRALDSLIGRVDVEDVLDEIFASFCLGK